MQEKEQYISPIKQRILHFASTLGISKRDFYSKIGVSRGTLESKTGITEDVITKFFATYPQVSIEWLMTGRGGMLQENLTGQTEVQSNNETNKEMASTEIVNTLLKTIREQAEEIGQLRERIAQMQQRFEKGAANANTDTIANVG